MKNVFSLLFVGLILLLASCGQVTQLPEAGEVTDEQLMTLDALTVDTLGSTTLTVPLGTINPGGSASHTANLYVLCDKKQHADTGAMSFSITSPNSEVSANASLNIPRNGNHAWPADGSDCKSPPQVANGSLAISVAVPSGASAGPRSVELTVVSDDKDLTGANSRVKVTVTYTVVSAPLDTTPPAVNITLPSPGGTGWFTTSPVIGSLSANDPSNVVGITCTGATVGAKTGLGTGTTSAPLTISAEGTTTITCTAKDGANNTGAANGSVNTGTVKIDTIAPAITPTDTTNTTWRNSPLSQTFTASDTVSGLAIAEDAGFTLKAELESASKDAPTVVSKTVNDKAGNSTTRTVSALIDLTKPTITLKSIEPAANNGWNKSDVVVTWDCTDDLSGVTAATVSQTVTGEGANLTATGTCTDTAGNTETGTQAVKIDRTAPVITDNGPTSQANANGWYKSAVTNSFAVSDALSGLAGEITSPIQVSSGAQEGNAVKVASGVVSDVAGNTNPGIDSAAFKIDLTAPTISAAADRAPNASGWYNDKVTVSFTCDDALSGIDGSCPANVSIDNETGGQAVSAPVSDKAGNSATSNTVTVKLDKTAPSITASAKTADGNTYTGGWTNQTVTVSFDCSDALSGIDGNCPASVEVSGDTSGQSVSKSVSDKAGNTATSNAITVQVDKTAPKVNATSSYTAGAWTNQAVTVSFDCADDSSGSGVASVTDPITVSKEGADQSASGTCTDNAGNGSSATFNNINIDKTKPVISGSRTPNANANGWNNTDVTASFTCSDVLSGIGTNNINGATVSNEGENHSVTNSGTCTDKAGNVADAAIVNGISIDKTAPTISGSASPAANAKGWNNSAVTVSFTCSDDRSGVASCSPSQTISSEGAGQSASGTVVDKADNSASKTVSDINIDTTAPTVKVTGVSNGLSYILGSVPTAGCETTDARSGVATNASVSLNGGPVGTVTATCRGGKDNADNTAADVSVSYKVEYNFTGFFSPVDMNGVYNVAKAGSAIPVKFRLNGDFGLGIITKISSYKIACPATIQTDLLEETAAGTTSGLKYDASIDQYNYTWKTATSLAGTCQRLEMQLNDGSPVKIAYFKFNK